MLSMTGFGTGRATDACGEVRVALSAVNNRAWQVQFKSELGDLALDDELKQLLRHALIRGSVTVSIQVFAAATVNVPDREALAAAWRELAALARELGAPPPALEHVARAVPSRAPTTAWGELARAAMGQAIAALQQTRTVEGLALSKALLSHAATLRDLHRQITRRAGERLPAWRDSLLKRVTEVLAEQASITPEHLVREIAIHAERIDVSEELVRLTAHLDALDVLLSCTNSSGEIGRKLEFLAQELTREINTTGAKANDAALTALILDAKLVVDHVKEQAANVA